MHKELLSEPTQIPYPAIAVNGAPVDIEIAHFVDVAAFKSLGLYFCLFTALAGDVDVQLVAYPVGPAGLVQPTGRGQFAGSTELAATALASTDEPDNLYTTPALVELGVTGIRVVARFSARVANNGAAAGSVTIAAGAILLPT
jgi:hypothetical protein